METFPAATVLDTQHDVDFMAKDSKRFQDSGGWGYGVFEYDAASGKFRLGNLSDKPPQANDAKCGVACHTIGKTRDYVFTDYAHRGRGTSGMFYFFGGYLGGLEPSRSEPVMPPRGPGTNA